MFRLLSLPLLAVLAAQSLPYRHVALRQQTADSVTVVASWSASHADSVRIAYGHGITRTRGPRGRDSVRVARPNSAATFAVTLTPIRGTVAGSPRVLSLALPVRPQPAPSIDSASVDTATTAPVVPPPPPPVPTAFTPNLPTGLTLVGDAEFDQESTPGMHLANWDRNTVQSPTTHGVARMTVDGRSVVRAWFPEQHAGNGVGPMTIVTQELNSRSLYVAVRLRYSPNYVFHTNGEKLVLPMATQPGDNGALVNVAGNGGIQALSGPMGAPGSLFETATGPVFPRGQWFTVEYFTRYNSPGQSDGIQRVWIDGRLVLDRSNVVLVVSGTQVLFRLGRLDFTRGGGASSVLTPLGGQWVDVDRLAFYTGT